MNTNIIMLSGMYIILGLYTAAFNNNDIQMAETTIRAACKVQAEQLASTGIAIGLGDMGNNAIELDHSTKTNLGEGTVVYTIKRSGIYGTITATSTFYKETSTHIAYVNYYHERWRVQRIYRN